MAADPAPARPHRNGTQIWPRLVDKGAHHGDRLGISPTASFGTTASKRSCSMRTARCATVFRQGVRRDPHRLFPGPHHDLLLLGVLEALAFLAVVASLVTGEFLPQRRKPILLSGLAFSLLVFAVMTSGQNIVSNYEGVASLFTYMGVTGIVYGLLRFVPMFRGDTATR